MKKKDAYLDWLDYRGLSYNHGLTHLDLYRAMYLRRYADESYVEWEDASPYHLVTSEYIA